MKITIYSWSIRDTRAPRDRPLTRKVLFFLATNRTCSRSYHCRPRSLLAFLISMQAGRLMKAWD